MPYSTLPATCEKSVRHYLHTYTRQSSRQPQKNVEIGLREINRQISFVAFCQQWHIAPCGHGSVMHILNFSTVFQNIH